MANAIPFAPPSESKTFNDGEKRVYGLATIHVGKEGKRAKVTFLKDGKRFPTDVEYMFDMDAFPRVPKLEPGSKEEFMVVLSADKSEVDKIGPVNGVYHAKLHEISRPEEGADPYFYEQTRTIQKGEKAGQEYKFNEFKLYFEIQRGRFKGVVVPCWLRYLWEENPYNPGYARWKGNPEYKNAVHLPKLVEISSQIGAVDSEMEWPEDGNILPEYFDRAIKADKMVMLVMSKGYIDTVSHSEYEDESPVYAAPGDDPDDEFEIEQKVRGEFNDDEFDEPSPVSRVKKAEPGKKPVKKNGNGKKDTKPDL